MKTSTLLLCFQLLCWTSFLSFHCEASDYDLRESTRELGKKKHWKKPRHKQRAVANETALEAKAPVEDDGSHDDSPKKDTMTVEQHIQKITGRLEQEPLKPNMRAKLEARLVALRNKKDAASESALEPNNGAGDSSLRAGQEDLDDVHAPRDNGYGNDGLQETDGGQTEPGVLPLSKHQDLEDSAKDDAPKAFAENPLLDLASCQSFGPGRTKEQRGSLKWGPHGSVLLSGTVWKYCPLPPTQQRTLTQNTTLSLQVSSVQGPVKGLAVCLALELSNESTKRLLDGLQEYGRPSLNVPLKCVQIAGSSTWESPGFVMPAKTSGEIGNYQLALGKEFFNNARNTKRLQLQKFLGETDMALSLVFIQVAPNHPADGVGSVELSNIDVFEDDELEVEERRRIQTIDTPYDDLPVPQVESGIIASYYNARNSDGTCTALPLPVNLDTSTFLSSELLQADDISTGSVISWTAYQGQTPIGNSGEAYCTEAIYRFWVHFKETADYTFSLDDVDDNAALWASPSQPIDTSEEPLLKVSLNSVQQSTTKNYNTDDIRYMELHYGQDTGPAILNFDITGGSFELYNPDLYGLWARYYNFDQDKIGTQTKLQNLKPIQPGGFISPIPGFQEFNWEAGEVGQSGLVDNVAAIFEGWVYCEVNGLWTWRLGSDDGSKLYISGNLVIENDGLHGVEYLEGTSWIATNHSWVHLRVEYFEHEGVAELSLERKSRLSTFERIPLTETSPYQPPGNVDANYFEYDGPSLPDSFVGLPLLSTDVAPRMDFYWKHYYIGNTNRTHAVAAAFVGYLSFDQSAKYDIQVTYNSAARVYIDNKLMLTAGDMTCAGVETAQYVYRFESSNPSYCVTTEGGKTEPALNDLGNYATLEECMQAANQHYIEYWSSDGRCRELEECPYPYECITRECSSYDMGVTTYKREVGPNTCASSFPFTADATESYKIRVEYSSGQSTNAMMRLEWKLQSSSSYEIIPTSNWNMIQCPPYSKIPLLAFKDIAICQCLPLYYNKINTDTLAIQQILEARQGDSFLSSWQDNYTVNFDTRYIEANKEGVACAKGFPIHATPHSLIIPAYGLLPNANYRVNVQVEFYNYFLPSPQWQPLAKYQNKDFSTFSNPASKERIILTSMLPGNDYKIMLTWYQDGNVVDSVVEYARTPCSCETKWANHSTAVDYYFALDPTGVPANFVARQHHGNIVFDLKDNSYCTQFFQFSRGVSEEAFTTVRTDSETSFVAVFTVSSPTKCSGGLISAGLAAADVLSESNLVVGKTYQYSARAAAALYMAPPPSEDPSSPLQFSHEAFSFVEIKWEASIDLKVTTLPANGASGVPNVHVAWGLLLNQPIESNQTDPGNSFAFVPETMGKGKTDADGNLNVQFLISKEDAAFLENTESFAFGFAFEKRSGMVQNTFSCNGGVVDCTNGTTVFLKHLQFGVPVTVYDNSLVPISGTLSVDGTDGLCPVAAATVCVVDSRTKQKRACSLSEDDGTYVVTAAFGNEVSLVVAYNDHEFIPTATSNYVPNLVIQDFGVYENFDFVDITTEELKVEVVGGLCDFTLGNSVILAKIPGCAWPGQELPTLHSAMDCLQVPAHMIQLQVTDIYDENDQRIENVYNYFQDPGQIKYINMTEVTSNRENLEDLSSTTWESCAPVVLPNPANASDNTTVQPPFVRFQYDGVLGMEVNFLSESIGGLIQYPIPGCPSLGESTALFNTNNQNPMEFYFEVGLFYTIQLNEEAPLICPIVNQTKQVNVTSEVGIDYLNNPPFTEWKNSLSYDPGLTECSPTELGYGGPCTYEVTQRDNNGTVYWSGIEGKLVAGRPNVAGKELNPPYSKPLTIQVIGEDVEQTIDCIVTGQFAGSPYNSIELPTYEPIMILRDPPGSRSYAVYENVATSITFYEIARSLKLTQKTGFAFGKQKAHERQACEGFLGEQECEQESELTTSKQKWQISVKEAFSEWIKGGGFNGPSTTRETFQYTTTWSYRTSDSPWNAGPDSDVFVVPQLSVNEHEVTSLEWNAAPACSLNSSTVTSFDVTPTNQESVGFYSRHAINNVIIPQLQEAASTAATSEEESQAQEGIKGWQKALAIADNEPMASGVSNWYQWYTAPNNYDPTLILNNEYERGPDDQDTFHKVWETQPGGLIPKSLAANATQLNASYAAGVSQSDLGKTNKVSFAGGTGLYTLKVKANMLWHKQGRGDASWQNTGEFKVGPSFGFTKNKIKKTKGEYTELADFGEYGKIFEQKTPEKKVEFNRFIEWDGVTVAYDLSNRATSGQSTYNETQIYVVLGDKDDLDYFDVELFVDERYGGIMFNTTGGASSCPHEQNTVQIHDPQLNVIKPSSTILWDDDMVFGLELYNANPHLAHFEIYPDNSQNSDGLKLTLSGASFSDKISFSNVGPDVVKATLTVARGPQLYQYDPIDIHVRASCPSNGEGTAFSPFNPSLIKKPLFNGNVDENLVFVQPCPSVEWADELARDHSFIVNSLSNSAEGNSPGYLQITIHNPLYAQASLQELASSSASRLEDVWLYFKYQGEAGSIAQWQQAIGKSNATSTETVLLNFAKEAKEDSFGYSSMLWELPYTTEGTAEGRYDIRVVSYCSISGQIRSKFDEHYTLTIPGTVDVTSPEQYGEPLPNAYNISLGEEVNVKFTEPISCVQYYNFSLLIQVASEDGKEVHFTQQNKEVKVVCEGRSLSFRFYPKVSDPTTQQSIPFTASISGIVDLNGNPLLQTVVIEKAILVSDSSSSGTTRFRLLSKDLDCTGRSPAATLRAKIQDILELPTSDRIHIGSVSCGDGTAEVGITNAPTIAQDGRHHGRMMAEDSSSMNLFYRLVDYSRQHSGIRKGPGFFHLSSVELISSATTMSNNAGIVPSLTPVVEHRQTGSSGTSNEELMAAIVRLQSENREEILRLQETNQMQQETQGILLVLLSLVGLAVSLLGVAALWLLIDKMRAGP